VKTPLAEVFFLPGNGARKLVDGTVMMMPESLLAFVDEVKMTGQLETPREGLMNIAASFPLVMKSRLSIQEEADKRLKVMPTSCMML
jgi:hypothetical protein